ncbi:hypothetical protein KGF57_004846 [Candida theae]|uniref:CWH43-like N-terminal domain-containing protein n=1 Tax=Candida theae TaxID=1198502 RepID=A0AAD5BAI1_9ASCO|nr:uncharacterized protein KGF57_004846 [Candida theae]KAI5949247.1 hypothetical protein KGF57_004846 [Candida theae]
MNGEYQDPVYLSDIGATNLQPLFISCAGFQAIFFVGTLAAGMFLRKTHRIQPYITKHQPRLAIASIIFAIIGQLGILFVSIFNTKNFHNVHLSMVGVFIAFIFFACCCDFGISFVFGTKPSLLDPVHDTVIFGKSRTSNLYFVSFVSKIVWLVVAIVLAACFGYYMKHGNDSLSAKFEWCICFWYGFLLVLWSLDLIPSAVRKYRSKHPELYQTNQYDYEKQQDGSKWESDLQNHARHPSSEIGDQPTFVNSPIMQNQRLAQQQYPNAEQHTQVPVTNAYGRQEPVAENYGGPDAYGRHAAVSDHYNDPDASGRQEPLAENYNNTAAYTPAPQQVYTR